MLHNYITVAYRVLYRQPAVAIINLAGFSLGLAVCFFIWLFAQYQLSYDSWIPEADTIYRLESTTHVPGRAPKPVALAPGIARDFLKNEFEEVVEAVRVIPYPETASIVWLQGEPLRVQRTLVDDGFFDVFQLEFLSGDPATALADNNSMVITASTAIRLFGTTDVAGRGLEASDPLTGDPMDYRITGVLADLPSNTHLNINTLARFDPIKFKNARSLIGSWFLRNTYMYLKLRNADDIRTLENGMPNFITRHIDTNKSEVLSALTPTEFMEFHLLPVADIQLYSRTMQQMKAIGDIGQVRLFLFGAGLVLAVAIINFINLATARTTLRAREVLLRKVLGARRHQLAGQFIGEALMLAAISFLLAIGAMELSLPLFNRLTGIDFAPSVFSLSNLVIFGAVALTAGIAAGLYPAVHLSGLKPGNLRQDSAGGGRSGVQFRSLLVVLQFAISISMLASVLVVRDQVLFANSADIGFRRDNLMVVRLSGATDQWRTLRTEITGLAGVKAVTATSNAPTDEDERQINVVLNGPEGSIRRAVSDIGIDSSFFDVMGIQFLAGHGPDAGDEAASDADELNSADAPIRNIVLNQSALALFGFGEPDNAINQQIALAGGEALRVVGVIPDLYYRSIHNEVRPTIYGLRTGLSSLLVKISEDADKMVIPAISNIWRNVRPDLPLSYSFTDDLVEKKYEGESRQLKLLTLFAGMTAFIATIGVFGLSLFTIERRSKEIAIRKVLGAGIPDILRLLLFQFSTPVLLANLIAWPIAWYFMSDWLQGFAYRIDMSPTPFLLAGGAALAIAWITVAGHAIKVARAKPIEALRYE